MEVGGSPWEQFVLSVTELSQLTLQHSTYTADVGNCGEQGTWKHPSLCPEPAAMGRCWVHVHTSLHSQCWGGDLALLASAVRVVEFRSEVLWVPGAALHMAFLFLYIFSFICVLTAELVSVCVKVFVWRNARHWTNCH